MRKGKTLYKMIKIKKKVTKLKVLHKVFTKEGYRIKMYYFLHVSSVMERS